MGKMIQTDIMKADVGSLLFIPDRKNCKKRPHICISVFRNLAGVPYDWMVVPITSTVTVGMENLVEVKHPKLSLQSYAKLNNITCIKSNKEIEVSKITFSEDYLTTIAVRIKELILKQ